MRASVSAAFFGLVLFLPALVSTLHCDFLQRYQQMLNSQILQLLVEKGPIVPPECPAQRTAFSFPKQSLQVKQPRLARKAVQEILRGLFSIFSSDLVKTGWVPERLLNEIHAQLVRIERCSVEEKTKPLSPEEQQSMLRLRRYFHSIRTTLEEKSHRTCAGITVQLEVRTSLTYLDQLTKRMNS